MSYPPKINCFVCDRMKGETNHWYLVIARESHVFAGSDTYLGKRGRLEITDFSEHGEGKPACGNSCTQKLVERWLHTGSLEAPRHAAGEPA